MTQLSRARQNARVMAARYAAWPTERNRIAAGVWASLAGTTFE